jgi:methyl coenzyme M reductase beta subunit
LSDKTPCSLSPFNASLFITIGRFHHYQVSIALVYSIHDSTEVAIQKMIDASQRMVAVNSQVGGEGREEGWGINPAMNRHLELEIKTLQNAPRDAAKLRRLLEIKQRQKEEADHIEDTQRLDTERLKC